MSERNKKFELWEWVKGLSTLIVVIVVCVKIYQTPIQLTVDFPTLLSLLLGFFSVALAALFYFKATETSNQFYDNTYKFTNQIAELLVKIESGFGEKLRNLDEGYASVRDYIQKPSSVSSESIETTKHKIEEEQKEVEKVLSERNKIIQDLISKSQLQEEEKGEISRALESKEGELAEAQKELSRMKKRLFAERMSKRSARREDINSGVLGFTESHVLKILGGPKVLETSLTSLKRMFNEITDDLPRQYIRDLEDAGLFEDGLNTSGAKFIHELARDYFA